LEARWAVFFDALGIKYEYEAEGYDLGGVWYLPDFWLPTFAGGLHCEVKPIGGDFRKAVHFTYVTRLPIWLCDGSPDFAAYRWVEAGLWFGDEGEEIPILRIELGIPSVSKIRGERHLYGLPYLYKSRIKLEHILMDKDLFFDDRYAAAVRASRQARFERGETPDAATVTAEGEAIDLAEWEQQEAQQARALASFVTALSKEERPIAAGGGKT